MPGWRRLPTSITTFGPSDPSWIALGSAGSSPPKRRYTASRTHLRTRGQYFRGTCLQRWAEDIVAANWDSLVFDLGAEPLRRVPMLEPLKGTKEHVAELFERCDTPRELLASLER